MQPLEHGLRPARDRAVAGDQRLDPAGLGQPPRAARSVRAVGRGLPVEPRDLEVREQVARDQQPAVGQLDRDLAVAVAGRLAQHEPPRARRERPLALGRRDRARRAGSRGSTTRRAARAHAVASARIAPASRRSSAASPACPTVPRLRPPRPPEHVVPVRVGEDDGDGPRPGRAHGGGEVVQLGGQHARVHEHRVLTVEQQRAVHPEHAALPHVHAAAEIGPGGHAPARRRATPTGRRSAPPRSRP